MKIKGNIYLLEITGTGQIILSEVEPPSKGDSEKQVSLFDQLQRSRLSPDKQNRQALALLNGNCDDLY